jgi:hypothetical protein
LHVNGNETRHNVTFPEMAEVGLFQLSVIIIYENIGNLQYKKIQKEYI